MPGVNLQQKIRSSRSSEVAEVGKIILGALAGTMSGIFLGAIVFHSLAIAIFGAMGGAVCGMVAAAKYSERPWE